MGYEVLTTGDQAIITETDTGLRMLVKDKSWTRIPRNATYCLATLYRIQAGFIPEKVLVFLAIPDTKLEKLKHAVDFYFQTVLKTELYVKEVPPDSALFAEESVRLYGKIIPKENNPALIFAAGSEI